MKDGNTRTVLIHDALIPDFEQWLTSRNLVLAEMTEDTSVVLPDRKLWDDIMRQMTAGDGVD